MSDELIEFVIDGPTERNGAIPADAFLAKLRAFVTMIYAFERAFTRKDKRQVELEIVDLTRRSPGRVKMKPRPRAKGYSPTPAMEWTFDQLDRLRSGQAIDHTIPQAVIDNIIDLAAHREAKLPEVSIMRAEFNGKAIAIDGALEGHALAIRAKHEANKGTPWRAGVSRGSLFGELRGVMDFEGERQFFIMPPSGPYRVQCVFSEDLRPKMNDHLFKVVRATGFLHYSDASPHPYLLEADAIDGVQPPTGHFKQLRGLFRGLEIDESSGEWA